MHVNPLFVHREGDIVVTVPIQEIGGQEIGGQEMGESNKKLCKVQSTKESEWKQQINKSMSHLTKNVLYAVIY